MEGSVTTAKDGTEGRITPPLGASKGVHPQEHYFMVVSS